jgi:hypothetical protein
MDDRSIVLAIRYIVLGLIGPLRDKEDYPRRYEVFLSIAFPMSTVSY